MFTKAECKIVRQIRKWLGEHTRPYMFWIGKRKDGSLTWEGGYDMPVEPEFRNQYTIPGPGKHIIKNWSYYE